MTEKELLHKRERKRQRRRQRKDVSKQIPKSQRKNKALRRELEMKLYERNLAKELDHLERVAFGTRQLMKLGEPLIEQSKQREIESNLVE